MKNFAKLLTTALMIGCLAAGIAGCGSSEGGKDEAAVKQTVIYTNSDEEAQTAIKNALDKNGFEGKYIMQSFGTSELGGKLAAEGKNIEANVVTMTSYYLDSDQKNIVWSESNGDGTINVQTAGRTPQLLCACAWQLRRTVCKHRRT